ncbi:MAG TPA: ATPase, T2SS/T4P/T4SS family [Candidatus Ozemobacteraceae bacterium]|nr:ATPase, T2SS/T4P/T4SS family [Candidatus Ozemobacteraceae bacterium]
MSTQKKRLGDILIDCNLITGDQLKQALGYQKEKGLKLGAALIDMGLVTEDDIIWALGNQLNISFIHLNADIVNPAAVKLVPAEFAKEFRLMPLYQAGNQLSVCMVDPLESEAIETLAARLGLQISVSICTKFDFEQAYTAIYGPLDAGERVTGDLPPAPSGEPGGEKGERGIPKGLEAPEKIINYMLGQAIINRVDRIHFEPSDKGVVIRFRTCSCLTRKLEIPIKVHQEVISKLKTLSQVPLPVSGGAPTMAVGHFRVSVSGRWVNVQSMFYPTVNGEMVILKLNDFSNIAVQLGKAGKAALDELVAFIQANHGVLYVTGPRESGRTTTQYYVLGSFDVEKKKIVTVEDPVQSNLSKITQIQIGQSGIGSIREGLDLALLLDPDVVYIDHLGDQPIVEELAFAGLGGKTIMTSFMAYDAPSSVVRLLEKIADPVVVASSLCGFLSQRLIRTLCPQCKKPSTLPPEIADRLRFPGEPTVFEAVGCEACQQTGYAGRTLITEFLPTSPTLRRMMIDRQGYQEFYQFARKQEIPTLEDRTLALVATGETSVDEFLRLF